MKKTQKMLIGVMLLGMLLLRVLPATAKTLPPPQKCESYDLTEEVSYLIEPDRKLNLSEEVKYRPSKIIKHVEKCNERMTTTILNPSEVWQSWMLQPVKTVADATGISYYDAEGKLLYQYPAEELAPGQASELAWEDEVAFGLTDHIYASAKKNNAEIMQTDKGYQMKGEGFLLEVNQLEMITQLTFFEKGEFAGSEKVFYTLIDGRPAKQYKIDRALEVDSSGGRIEKIIVSTFSNYRSI